MADTTEDTGKGSEKPMAIFHIPQEIVVQILSQLPVKTLLRFKSVCKLWKSLLSDPEFSLSRDKGRERAIFCCSVRKQYDHGVTTEKVLCSSHNKFSPEELFNPVGIDLSDLLFLGSCNGLILLCAVGSHWLYVYLWNPSTRCCREWTQVSVSMDFNLYDSLPRLQIAAGLCFDECCDDYKAVVVTSKSTRVLSLRGRREWTNSRLPYEIFLSTYSLEVKAASGVLANGHLHWIATERQKWSQLFIVRFNKTENQFDKFPTPEPRNPYIFQLGELDGCLCMFRYGKSEHEYDFLIMREYGVMESWTTLFSIPERGPRELDYVSGLVPTIFSESREECLVRSCGHLLVYNIKDMSFKKIVVNGQSYDYIDHGPLTYVESLASV